MYSLQNLARLPRPALQSAGLLYGTGMRLMEAMRLRIAAGTVASPLDRLSAHA